MQLTSVIIINVIIRVLIGHESRLCIFN